MESPDGCACDAALPVQPGTAAVQEKRKAVGRQPKKQQ
jgi:hypothetical protein